MFFKDIGILKKSKERLFRKFKPSISKAEDKNFTSNEYIALKITVNGAIDDITADEVTAMNLITDATTGMVTATIDGNAAQLKLLSANIF